RLVNSEANSKRINFVEQCFGVSGQPLAAPRRVLVGEGVLTKMCRKKPKPRQFFLFNDILVYGNIIINKKKYNKQHIINLEDVSLESVPDEGELYNGWQIISPSKSFTVYAATAMEKVEWMAHITRCIQELHKTRGKKSMVTEASPVWVPDNNADVCMRCRKSEFNVINRRHHCRKCGFVCCNDCTNKRWLLPCISTKPVRVCNVCYESLAQAGTSVCVSVCLSVGWLLMIVKVFCASVG
ncbi:hypothetical protein HELRODRAFT_77354, partial [Helobdella robusta]|uniref:FYVE-type domain-containing protein n=1 Tax=Helobdella robusta TaxID=6412 RepID=T1G2W8_HELRO